MAYFVYPSFAYGAVAILGWACAELENLPVRSRKLWRSNHCWNSENLCANRPEGSRAILVALLIAKLYAR